jgi:siroheme synthase
VIAERLIAGGMAADTPVAVVTSATLPDQHVTRTDLASLGETPVASPSVIVIGEVAAARVLDPVLHAALPAALAAEGAIR